MASEELLKIRREKFLLWAKDNFFDDVGEEQMCWQAWNAALDSLQISLPKMCDGNKPLEIGYDAGIEECADVITRQGIKIDVEVIEEGK